MGGRVGDDCRSRAGAESRWPLSLIQMLLRKLILWPQRLQQMHFAFLIFHFPCSRVFYFHSIFVILPTNEAENVFDYFCCVC